MAVLIGLGHRARSGKDTVADHLVAKYGFKKVSWAGLLKEGVNAWHGWDDRHAYGDLKEEVDPYWGYSPRHAYQQIGTDLMRKRWRDSFWVDCAMRQIRAYLKDGISVAVADTRFPNEAQAVLDEGGQMWQVDRPELGLLAVPPTNPFLRWLSEKVLGKKYDHASETGLARFNRWDQVLVNDGSLADLYAKVDEIMPRSASEAAPVPRKKRPRSGARR